MEEGRERSSPCLDYSKIISQTKHFSTETKATGTLADLPPPNLRPQLLLLLLFFLRHKCRTHVNRDILRLFFFLPLGASFARLPVRNCNWNWRHFLLNIQSVVVVSRCCCFLGSGLFAYFHKHISPLLGTPQETPPVSDSFELPYANPLSAFGRISARFMACQETRHDSHTHTHTQSCTKANGRWPLDENENAFDRKRTEKVIHPAKTPL